MLNKTKIIEMAQAVLETEIEAIKSLFDIIDDNFVNICDLLINCKGKIIVLGVGKSGHIGSKIASTFSSTGSPAFFVHASEAGHGDMGLLDEKDVVFMVSNSGETSEITDLLPFIKRLGIPLIAMTGNDNSTIAKTADFHLCVRVKKEACPFGLAPTASSTAALAMGDAIAIALLQVRGFTKDDFKISHPGGHMGRRMLLLLEDIMYIDDDIPKVNKDLMLSDALIETTRKGLGMTAVIDKNDYVLGVFTDGDLRRVINKKVDINITPISTVMNTECITITPDVLAVDALQLMEERKINALIIVDSNKKIIGAINMHTLLREGLKV